MAEVTTLVEPCNLPAMVPPAKVSAYTEPRDGVLEAADAAGFEVTPQQLARWHRSGLLPRPVQRGQGRGRGTVTLYPGGTSRQLVALCRARSGTRDLVRVGFRMWWQGFDVDPGLVERVLRGTAVRLDERVRLHAEETSSEGMANLAGVSFVDVVERSEMADFEHARDAVAEVFSVLGRWAGPASVLLGWRFPTDVSSTRGDRIRGSDMPALLVIQLAMIDQGEPE
jgi:hypothetical protein